MGLVSWCATAQNDDAAEAVDSSYYFYSQKDWKSLVQNGKTILKYNADYYYLRMRMGIAYYEMSQYLLAAPQFKKAIALNNLETLPQEYLYYCYLFTGQTAQSRRIAKKFNVALKSKIKFDGIPVLNYGGIDGGAKLSNDEGIPTASVFSAYVGHQLNKSVFFDHKFDVYNQSNDTWDYHQKEYFIQSTIPLQHDFKVAGSFHYVSSNFVLNTPLNSSESDSSIALVSVEMEKVIKRHRFAAGATGVGLGNDFQMQYNTDYSYYPLSNNRLYFGVKGYINNSTHDSSGYHFSPLLYVSYQPTMKLRFFASYLNNGGDNLIEWNGAMVNNSPDLTTGRLAITSTYSVSKKTDLSLTYQNEQKTSSFNPDYSYNSFFVSLKFNFL